MERRSPVTIGLTVLAYMVATFGIQGASHFAVNAEFYATLPFMRSQAIVPMGFAAMIIQGTIFALLFPAFNRDGRTMRNALVFAWTIGAFLASYIVLGEAGKYAVPSILDWALVEGSVAFVQFTVFGALLGLVHRHSARAVARQAA